MFCNKSILGTALIRSCHGHRTKHFCIYTKYFRITLNWKDSSLGRPNKPTLPHLINPLTRLSALTPSQNTASITAYNVVLYNRIKAGRTTYSACTSNINKSANSNCQCTEITRRQRMAYTTHSNSFSSSRTGFTQHPPLPTGSPQTFQRVPCVNSEGPHHKFSDTAGGVVCFS